MGGFRGRGDAHGLGDAIVLVLAAAGLATFMGSLMAVSCGVAVIGLVPVGLAMMVGLGAAAITGVEGPAD